MATALQVLASIFMGMCEERRRVQRAAGGPSGRVMPATLDLEDLLSAMIHEEGPAKDDWQRIAQAMAQGLGTCTAFIIANT